MRQKCCVVLMFLVAFYAIIVLIAIYSSVDETNRDETIHNTIESESKRGVFTSADFWNVSDKPVLANGHIGFVPYGDSIYMNGLYNGLKGDSHRARIPNYANVQFEPCTQRSSKNAEVCAYELDIYNGVFRTQVQLNDGCVSVEHIQYAHRHHETALVNQIRLKRNPILTENGNGEVYFQLLIKTKFVHFLKKIFSFVKCVDLLYKSN